MLLVWGERAVSCATRDEARDQALELLTATGLANDWRLRVWENLGWHWELRRVPWRLRAYQHGGHPWRWSASIYEDDTAGYRPGWGDSGFATPQKAMLAVLASAEREVDELTARWEFAQESAQVPD